MEKTTEICYPLQIKACIGENLKVSLNIRDAKYDIPLECLFSMAARDNPKRRFLFVSKILGKHIPINPLILKIIGGILARSWLQDAYKVISEDTLTLIEALKSLQGMNTTRVDLNKINEIISSQLELREKTLFIGFAETATGISQAVFSCFKNAAYIHTTREDIHELSPSFIFKEEHSHAVDHSIYSLDKDFLNSYDRIVLIDDELTTGNTALNLMRNLPGKTFGIITVLDWRNDVQLDKFKHLKEVDIKVSSIVKGDINYIQEGEFDISDTTMDIEKSTTAAYRDISFPNNKPILNGYLSCTGRFGITSKDTSSINEEFKKTGTYLKEFRTKGNCLCIGTEEFIFSPCMISAELGEKVYFHSTTRSPILSRDLEGYCITNKIKFPCPFDETRINYIYNIPKDFYDQVFIFSEKPIPTKSKEIFKDIFSTLNIKDIIFVSWH